MINTNRSRRTSRLSPGIRVTACVILSSLCFVRAGGEPIKKIAEQDTESNVLSAIATNLHVKRLAANPIIRPEMLPNNDGTNINGPSLIRVPDWLLNPLGKYYLYFADHRGKYIRLAYCDSLAGP